MKFFDLFKSKNGPNNENDYGQLHSKLSQLLGLTNEQEILKCACVAGLLARVAFVDFKIAPQEKLFINSALKSWTNFSESQIEAISKIAVDEIKALAGLENHKYCQYLNEILDNDEKYELVETLFAVAGSDEQVNVNEIEEIRLINRSLLLEHKHFISAQVTVLKKLASLKS
jgi:uncharacterized tellurite resistance protein B-like protein